MEEEAAGAWKKKQLVPSTVPGRRSSMHGKSVIFVFPFLILGGTKQVHEISWILDLGFLKSWNSGFWKLGGTGESVYSCADLLTVCMVHIYTSEYACAARPVSIPCRPEYHVLYDVIFDSWMMETSDS